MLFKIKQMFTIIKILAKVNNNLFFSVTAKT